MKQGELNGSETENVPENYIPEQSNHNSESDEIEHEGSEKLKQSRENQRWECDSDDGPLSWLAKSFYGKNRFK